MSLLPKPFGKLFHRGTNMHIGSNGVPQISATHGAHLEILEDIQSVGVAHIGDLETHQITRAVGVVSHFLRFLDGGEVRFACTAAGDLLEFSASAGVGVRVQDGTRITLISASQQAREQR